MKKVLFFLLVMFSCFVNASPSRHKRHGAPVLDTLNAWQRTNLLLALRQPKSALTVVDSTYRAALAAGDSVSALRAQLYFMVITRDTSEDADKDVIRLAEAYAAVAPFPYKAIWQSIAAQQYLKYYDDNRFEMPEQTPVSGQTDNDVATWDAGMFFKKAGALYDASVANADALKQVSISKFDSILSKGNVGESLRPTLYDLLAYRALNFYTSDEHHIPGSDPLMNDTALFKAAAAFTKYHFAPAAPAGYKWKAVWLYQEMMRQHLNDANKDALLDADLQRLEFIYKKTMLPDRKQRYAWNLQDIEAHNSGNPLAATAALKLIELECGESLNHYNEYKFDIKPEKRKIDFVKTDSNLGNIIDRWPGSMGAKNAAAFREVLRQKKVGFKAEDVVLPGEPWKIMIEYRNVTTVHIKIVRVSDPEFMARKDGLLKQQLAQETPVLQYDVNLPGSADYYLHRTEIKTDPLPKGEYCLLVSYNDSFSFNDNIMAWGYFQASRLAYLCQNGTKNRNYLLDRKTGAPVNGAKILFVNKTYNKSGTRETTTDNNGSFSFGFGGNDYEYGYILARYGGDSLYGNYREWNYNRNRNEADTITYLLTDRGIYRPGQTIYYKGIVVYKTDGGRKPIVVPDRSTTVLLKDENDVEVGKQSVETNDFGSYTGSFVIPENILPGEFTLSDGTGTHSIQVEEYKRPKFSLVFDTLKSETEVGDNIAVTGRARAYAGNNIDGATIKYTVTRTTESNDDIFERFHQGESETISTGATTTDASGTFTISFVAEADQSIEQQKTDVFHYVVSVTATDMNGETQEGTQSVNAGYTSLVLQTDIPEEAEAAKLTHLKASTYNLNGVFERSQTELTISKLKEPAGIVRPRQWDAPDEYLLTESEFKKDFPEDEYRNESDYKTWPAQHVAYSAKFETQQNGEVAVPAETWQENGWYRVELKTKDKHGNDITTKRYVQIRDAFGKGAINDPTLFTVEPDEVAGGAPGVYISSSQDNCNFLVETRTGKGLTTEWLTNDDAGESRIWQPSLGTDDMGQVPVLVGTMKNNRWYEKEITLQVPWKNRNLKLKWETHRDNLLPGAKEKWMVTITGDHKEKVAAELAATLYDASLDAFKSNDWRLSGLFPNYPGIEHFQDDAGILNDRIAIADMNRRHANFVQNNYPDLFSDRAFYAYMWGRSGRGDYAEMRGYNVAVAGRNARLDTMEVTDPVTGSSGTRYVIDGVAVKGTVGENMPQGSVERDELRTLPTVEVADLVSLAPGIYEGKGKATHRMPDVPMRKNLRETAFFYPQLRTDDSGNVKIEFTLPEALTQWKFMALAHTKGLATGTLEGYVRTQKSLMVFPNLPRFFRQGDDMVITTKVSNLDVIDELGSAKIEIVDAETLKPITGRFKIEQQEKGFSVYGGKSTTVSWTVHVPDDQYNPVAVRISASAGDFTDGEENTLPVVSNRMLVTESLPIWINGNGSKTMTMSALLHADTSKTIVQHALTVEYTANPAWYAILALPYLAEFPHECAEQTFNRFYANAIAAHIANSSPKIREVFGKWLHADTATLLSNLDKNPELKTTLLQETPWVMQAKSETEQRHRIALLFNAATLTSGLSAITKKLEDMQSLSGGFPWFKGGDNDRYITQYIVTGIGKLLKMRVIKEDDDMVSLAKRAIGYLDGAQKKSYDELRKKGADMSKQHIGNEDVQYLYARSYFMQLPLQHNSQAAYYYYLHQAGAWQATFNNYTRGMIALAYERMGYNDTAKLVMQSLDELAHHSDELGMYWSGNAGYRWYEAPIEAQALMIECFSEINKDRQSVNDMKRWLLRNKQTESWATTKATADACYALLMEGSDWLAKEPDVKIKLGKAEVTNKESGKAGLGYLKTRIAAKEVRPEMGNITLTVAGNQAGTSWGGVYWQYFQDIDKVLAADAGVSVRKEYYITRNGETGKILAAVTDKDVLHIGDKVTVRMVVTATRDLEYVQLKDMRPACFEPGITTSGYEYDGGLYCYKAITDAATHFFISHLARGTYVVEYPVYVAQAGRFSSGVATVQCMYAPEYGSHSAGIRLRVE